MNICFVYKHCPFFDNYKDSGIGSYIQLISKNLSKKHSVFVVTESSKRNVLIKDKTTVYSIKNVKLPIFKKRIIAFCLSNFRIAWTLFILNRKYHFDIIEFANWEVEGLIFTLLSIIFKFSGKIVCRLHTGTYDNDNYNNRIRSSTFIIHYFESLFLKLPNVYLYTSTLAHAKRCKKLYKLSDKKINIVPLGTILPKNDVDKYINKTKKEDFNIVFIGRMEKRKGILTLLKAIPIVLKKEPRAFFYLIGKIDIDILSFIKKTVPTHFLTRISYLGYLNSEEQKNYFLNFADICVFPSLYESFGYSIIEAMSYGKPVISTKVGGIPEIITHGLDGYLILPKNYRSLANAINTILSDQKMRKRIGNNARSTIEKRFTDSRFCRETEQFYFKVLTNCHI